MQKAGISGLFYILWLVRNRPTLHSGLFDFSFFENNMFAYDRVVFVEFEFFRRITRIFPGYVIVASVRSADEFD